jgi:hypothetical protein
VVGRHIADECPTDAQSNDMWPIGVCSMGV